MSTNRKAINQRVAQLAADHARNYANRAEGVTFGDDEEGLEDELGLVPTQPGSDEREGIVGEAGRQVTNSTELDVGDFVDTHREARRLVSPPEKSLRKKAVNRPVMRTALDRTRNWANQHNVGQDTDAQQDVVRGHVRTAIRNANSPVEDFDDTADAAQDAIAPPAQNNQANYARRNAMNNQANNYASSRPAAPKVTPRVKMAVDKRAGDLALHAAEDRYPGYEDYHEPGGAALESLQQGINSGRIQNWDDFDDTRRVVDNEIFRTARERRSARSQREFEAMHPEYAQKKPATEGEATPQELNTKQPSSSWLRRMFGRKKSMDAKQKNLLARKHILVAAKFLESLAYEKAFGADHQMMAVKHHDELNKIIEALESVRDSDEAEEDLEDEVLDMDEVGDVVSGIDIADPPVGEGEEDMPANVLRQEELDVGDIGHKMAINRDVARRAVNEARRMRQHGEPIYVAENVAHDDVLEAELNNELDEEDGTDTYNIVHDIVRDRTDRPKFTDKQLEKQLIEQHKQLEQLAQQLSLFS